MVTNVCMGKADRHGFSQSRCFPDYGDLISITLMLGWPFRPPCSLISFHQDIILVPAQQGKSGRHWQTDCGKNCVTLKFPLLEAGSSKGVVGMALGLRECVSIHSFNKREPFLV